MKLQSIAVILFAIVIRCAASVENVSEVTWYPTKAIADSANKTLITPGIVIATGDTLFKIEQYRSNYQISTLVWSKAQVCSWMLDSYKSINFDLERLQEEYDRLVEQQQETLERRALLINWYKKFKVNFGIDCNKEITK